MSNSAFEPKRGAGQARRFRRADWIYKRGLTKNHKINLTTKHCKTVRIGYNSTCMTVMIACNAGRQLATKLYEICIAQAHNRPDNWRIELDGQHRYPNGEVYFELEAELTGDRVVIVQQIWDIDGNNELNDNLISLLAAARLSKERGAVEVIAVVPMLAYYRHDRHEMQPRGPVATSFLADLMASSGIDQLVTWHLSDGAIASWPITPRLIAFDPADWFVSEFKHYDNVSDTVVVSPDKGAERIAKRVAERLGISLVPAVKKRVSPLTVTGVEFADSGLETCRHILVLDDLIATGRTMYGLIERLREVCPSCDIEVAVSHLAPVDFDAICRVRGLVEQLGVNRIVTSGTAFNELPPELRYVVETRFETLLQAIASYLN